MSAVRRIDTVATVDVPHGAWCREEGGEWLPDPALSEPGGVAAGPHADLGYVPKGEALQIQADGGVMLGDGEYLVGRWVHLHHGRIVS